VKPLALALLLPGCDVLFGIDKVPPAIEVNHGHVTISYSWTVATQTVSGPTIAAAVAAPPDYIDVRAQLLDGTNLPVAHTTPMTFELTLPPGATYVLHTQTKDAPTAIELETSAATVTIVDDVLDRLDAMPATLPIPVDFALAYSTPIVPSNYPVLVAIGARVQVNFSNTSVVAPHLDDWRTAVTGEGVHGPLLSTTSYQDRFVVQRWASDFATTQWMSDALADPIDMVDGQPIEHGALGAELLVPPVNRDRCAEIDAPRMTVAQRIVDLTGWTSPATGWAVSSTVSLAAPPSYLLPLAANYDGTSDQVRDVNYGSPFPGEADVAVLGVNVQKQLAIPGSIPVTLYAGTSNVTPVPPSTAASCAPVSFGPIGLATAVSIADQMLATDGQTVMIDRSQRVPFELTIDGGPYDDAYVLLDEVVADNGVTTLRPIISFRMNSDPPAASIDPTLLVHNHYYMFDTFTQSGFPRASALDPSVIAYPYASSQAYSTLFKVGN
jgi:hypothetical protein